MAGVLAETSLFHNNSLELFQDPALEELVGAVADVDLEVVPRLSTDHLQERSGIDQE